MKEYSTIGSGWEEELIKFYKKYYIDILTELGIEFWMKQEGPGMGALIIFSGQNIKFKIINDRGQYFIEISNGKGEENWCSLETLLLFLDVKNNSIQTTKQSELTEQLLKKYSWTNFDQNPKSFKSNFGRIKEMYSDDRISDTVQELKEFKRSVSKLRFK